MKRKCEECIFWEYFDSATEEESQYEEDTLGNCARFPPVFIGVQPNSRVYSPLNWSQPITTGKAACGEWKPQPKSEVGPK